MVAPVVAAGVMTIARFIASKGITQAIKKYGSKAANEAKKHVKDLTTKPTAGQKKIRTPVAAQRASRRAKRIGAAVGVAGAGGVGAVAYKDIKNKLAKAKVNLKKAKTAEMKAKERANIEKLMRQLQKADSMPRTKPKKRPTQ